MNKYKELMKRQKEERDLFPLIFAFDDDQLKDSLKKLGFKETDRDKVLYIGNNFYIPKDKMKDWDQMNIRHISELKEEINKDKTGTGFIYDMFFCELNNHEFSYTEDYEDTLKALHITEKDLQTNKNLRHGLDLAMKDILEKQEDFEL